jgi:hypothetical protein
MAQETKTLIEVLPLLWEGIFHRFPEYSSGSGSRWVAGKVTEGSVIAGFG